MTKRQDNRDNQANQGSPDNQGSQDGLSIDLGGIIRGPALDCGAALEAMFRAHGGGLEMILKLDRMIELDTSGQRSSIAAMVEGLRTQLQCAVS